MIFTVEESAFKQTMRGVLEVAERVVGAIWTDTAVRRFRGDDLREAARPSSLASWEAGFVGGVCPNYF